MALKLFPGKKVLITGGSKGLGLVTARMFAKEGSDLFLAYRSDEASAKKAADAITKDFGVKCSLIQTDLSMEGGSDHLFDQVQKHTPNLDIYIHNAAATAFKSLNELESHHIDKTLNITIKSFILGMKRVTPMMKDGGAVVTVSGMDTLRAVPRHALLGAAKSALQTLTAYYAHELGPNKIRVNSVNPGFFETESTRKYLGPTFDLVSSGFEKSVPVQSESPIEDIANVILFLCSDKSKWLVGQTLYPDGGFQFAMPTLLPGGSGKKK
jgi:enoyl-[acyl-carrier protein] reductase III